MSEEQQNEGAEQQPEGQQQATNEFTPITSQEDFEKALGKRLERERAKFGDYADLKVKAEQFDELEEAKKSETDKLTERLSAAEASALEAGTTLARYKVAAEKQIPSDLIDLISGNTEEEMAANADRLLAHIAKEPPAPSFDGGGRTTPNTPAGMSDLIRKAAGRA